jgi:hypothetical protein
VFVTLPSVIGSPGGCLLLLLIFIAPFVSPECISKFGHGIVNVTHPGVYPVKLDLEAIKTCRMRSTTCIAMRSTCIVKRSARRTALRTSARVISRWCSCRSGSGAGSAGCFVLMYPLRVASGTLLVADE